MTVLAPPAPAWEALADTVLQAEAAAARLSRGRAPSDFAGLFVTDADAARLLAELPGLADGRTSAENGLDAALAAAVQGARAALDASLADDSPFSRLARTARLDGDGAAALALVIAVDADPRRQRLVGYLQDDLTLPRLTLATLAALGLAGAVAPGSRLDRAALVEVAEDGPWGRRMAAPAAEAVWAAAGLSPLRPALNADVLDGPGGGAPLVLVHGGDGPARVRTGVTSSSATSFVVADEPADEAGWRALVLAAALAGGGAVVHAAGARLSHAARRWIEQADHLGWVVCAPHELPLDSLPRRPWVERAADRAPAPAEDWRRLLGVEPPPGHVLTPTQLHLVAAAASGAGGSGVGVGDAVRRLAGGHLGAVARRIRPRRGWADVVLPDDQAARLRELAARYRHRGTVHGEWGFGGGAGGRSRGLVALFAGPSGTGKTLAAEVVAGELGLDLYQVDLSALVSKWVGETEKNLEAVFEGAGHGGLALFFDEADAVFGRRSEVSDAHDRYANVETAYLLQRIEHFDGLVVLATNLQRNIDTAFLRRVHVAVDFTEPDEPRRRAIWALAFPPGAPVDVAGADLDALAAEWKLTGGSIANVALHAAFLAADAGTPITLALVQAALRRELQKLGRLCLPTEA